MDASMVSELNKSFDLVLVFFQKLMPVSVPIFSFLCVLQVAKNIINRSYGIGYDYSNSLSNDNDEMIIEDVDETPEVMQEAVPEQADTEKEKQKRIRYGGVCPYCCGVLTRVYSKKDKLKYVHCEYCGQVIDTS